MKILLALVLVLGAVSPSRTVYERVASLVDASLPSGQLIVSVAKSLEGTPYVSSSIEGEGPESLKVNLDRTDCILFVEACVAFVMDLKSPSPSFENFIGCVRSLRYRGGVVDGYGSRIHYTSEWLSQAGSLGVLREYTAECGEEFHQDFSYMTLHQDRYPSMDRESAALIAAVEQALEGKNPYFRIPHDKIQQALPVIGEGDIIAFTSKVRGLDIAHVAIACKSSDGRMHFIHASSRYKKVLLEPSALEDYPSEGLRLARLVI